MTAPAASLVNHATVTIPPDERGLALHWLRRRQGLTGTKEGCGEGECGACTVLLGELTDDTRVRYRAVASCLVPVCELVGRHVVTVEGLNPPDGLTPVQQALVDAGAPQCGFCFPGIVMSLTGFLLCSEDLSPEAAAIALDGNICRCTGYSSIRRAVHALCDEARRRLHGVDDRVPVLVEWGVLPATFTDVPAILKDLPTRSGRSTPGYHSPVLVAGGTDLIIQQPELLELGDLDLVSRRRDLQTIELELEHLRLGGGVDLERLRHDPDVLAVVPQMPAILERFASTIIRNRATVAGNLVNASPIGDLTVLLLALDAELELHTADNERRLPLGRFYNGYKDLDLQPGEVVTAVRVPRHVAQDGLSYEKISQRRNLDIASVNSVLRVGLDDGGLVTHAALAVGGVAPVPLLVPDAAAALVGRPLDADAVDAAAAILDAAIAPIDDVRGSADYKRELARRTLIAHARRLVPEVTS